MTPPDLIRFEALSRLAIARSTQLDEVALEVYGEALADLDAELVQRACLDLAKRTRDAYESPMPSVGTIREWVEAQVKLDAAAIALKLLKPVKDESEPTYYCLDCRDEPSGWRIYQCPSVHCGRKKTHPPHTYAEKCACLPFNPVSHAARERMNAARAKAEQKQQRRHA